MDEPSSVGLLNFQLRNLFNNVILRSELISE
jgi:hypothetical protein